MGDGKEYNITCREYVGNKVANILVSEAKCLDFNMAISTLVTLTIGELVDEPGIVVGVRENYGPDEETVLCITLTCHQNKIIYVSKKDLSQVKEKPE